jgi:hypothetical protein
MFDLEDVKAAALGDVEAKTICAAFTDMLPPPKVEIKNRNLGWRKIRIHLVAVGLLPLAVDTAFCMLHNILPLQVCRYHLQLASLLACPHCDAPV